MIQSSSESTASSTASAAASPTPISPFSSYSVNSEATSDDLPDLGAFTTVFRALNHLQPPRSFAVPIPLSVPSRDDTQTASSSVPISLSISQSEADSDAPGRIIASYLNAHSRTSRQDTDVSDDLPSPDSEGDEDYESGSASGSGSGSGSGSDTEGEPEGRLVEIEGFSDVDADGQPSLGYLDEALSFLAAERAKYTAQRDKPVTSDSAWKHVIEPRRKRRRKKSKTRFQLLRRDNNDDVNSTPHAEEFINTTSGDQDDDDDSSSSLDLGLPSSYPYNKHKSTPGTPSRRKEKRKQRKALTTESKLRHSKSTPNLDNALSAPIDPRVLQLRTLATKLRLLFPEESAALNALLSNDFPGGAEFPDPRGPAPGPQDTLIHVFIDHSNILIGLLTYLKRHHRNDPRKLKHMSHAALALILERGRPITRRCVVTSSPLYQPMDTAEQLGYEVRVYARVPDMGNGDDRRKSVDLGSSGNPKGHWRKNSGGSFRKGHAHKGSNGGNTSTESEQGGNAAGFPQGFVRSFGSAAKHLAASTSQPGGAISSNGTPTNNNTVRIRYREQGVDELLQLKLHQAIADVDTPPPNATIVLATGDGNVGQFNEDGFLGPVRTALKKGWKVELYAWAEGLSKAWVREFGEGPYKERFRIIEMEKFGADLLLIGS